ncbi:MAG: DUF333 domain-containing protein [bacterium]
MNTKIKTGLGLIIILILVITIGVFVWQARKKQQGTSNIDTGQVSEQADNYQNSTQIANPASVYCEQNGGKSEILKNENSEPKGFCIFPDGVVCEEWQNYRGECRLRDVKKVDTTNWKLYRSDKYGFEFRYPEECGQVQVSESENDCGPRYNCTGKTMCIKFSNGKCLVRGSSISHDWEGPATEGIPPFYKFDGNLWTTRCDFNCQIINPSNNIQDARVLGFIFPCYKSGEMCFSSEYFEYNAWINYENDKFVGMNFFVTLSNDQIIKQTREAHILYTDSQDEESYKRLRNIFEKTVLNDQNLNFQMDLISGIAQTFHNYYFDNWQTYRNEKYGFEFRYPNDWVINTNNSQRITLNSSENEQNKKDIESGKMYGEGYLEDIIFSYYNSLLDEPENSGNNINAKTLEEFVNKNQLISNKEKINFSGDIAWSMTRGGFGAYYTILDVHNEHLYEIMFGRKSNKSDLSATENQILSTFKFIP